MTPFLSKTEATCPSPCRPRRPPAIIGVVKKSRRPSQFQSTRVTVKSAADLQAHDSFQLASQSDPSPKSQQRRERCGKQAADSRRHGAIVIVKPVSSAPPKPPDRQQPRPNWLSPCRSRRAHETSSARLPQTSGGGKLGHQLENRFHASQPPPS